MSCPRGIREIDKRPLRFDSRSLLFAGLFWQFIFCFCGYCTDYDCFFVPIHLDYVIADVLQCGVCSSSRFIPLSFRDISHRRVLFRLSHVDAWVLDFFHAAWTLFIRVWCCDPLQGVDFR